MATPRHRPSESRTARTVPTDLLVLAIFVLITDAVYVLSPTADTVLKVVLGLILILFVPGYAFVAAVFPERGRRSERSGEDEIPENRLVREFQSRIRKSGIGGIERFVLSVGVSIAVVPLVGLVIDMTVWSITSFSAVFSVSGFALVVLAIAAIRRVRLPVDERYRLPLEEWIAHRPTVFGGTGTNLALNLLLATSVLVGAGAVVYTTTTPANSDTEFFLLTETESGGLVADDYPTDLRQGESERFVTGIHNDEHRPMTYSVVVELQRVRLTEESRTIMSKQDVGRLSTHIADGQTEMVRFDISPRLSGDHLRLAFMLYRGDPPENPTVDGAYRSTQLWINVSA